MNNIIEATEYTIKKSKELMKESNLNDSYFIRVSVKSGGCSGLKYDLNFDNKINDGDSISDLGGLKIVCDKKSVLYLIGTTLDYSGGLNGKGFIFNNPNSKRSCGCGESFSL